MDEIKALATDVYEINITAKRIKGERPDGSKYDFLAWTGYDKHGHKCKMKFTRDVKNLPQDAGEYVMIVSKGAINRDNSTRYLEYWVRDVVEFKPYEPHFDENTEDLPF